MKSLLFKESEQLVILITLLYVILMPKYDNTKLLFIYFITIGFLYWFYRNPDRYDEHRTDEFIYSPAEGKILLH